jgi:Family of unknown function (DUF6167)
MKRVFWIALGATAGVLVVRKLQKTAHAYTPAGLAESVQGVGDSLRYFAEEVRAGMAEREIELRDALGIDEDPGSDDQSSQAARPTGHRRSVG